MLPINWKKFLHPAGVYRLEYPAHWDQAQKDEGRSCGFGPHDRDDVGLWISLMPVSVDTDRLAEELPKILEPGAPADGGGNIRRDPTLRHYGVKADVHKEGEGGHYWLIAGGDVVLFASSQLPAAERDIWNPTFERLMATLEITRDEELALRQLTDRGAGTVAATASRARLPARRERDPRAKPRRVSEQPSSGGSRSSRPSGPDHPAFRAEPGPVHGSANGAGNLGRGASSPAPPLEASQLPRFRLRRPAFARQ